MPQLLDYRGRPVSTAELKESKAEARVGSVRSPFAELVSPNLTPARLGQVLRQVRSNDNIQDYLSLAEEVEEAEHHYRSVLSTRKMAVAGLPVTVEAASDDKRDQEIADDVRGLLTDDPMLGLAEDMLDGLAKSFAAIEIDWDTSEKQWRPRCYDWRDPRFFQFDRDKGRELRLRDEKDLVNGIPLDPFKWIVHTPKLKSGLTIRGGLAMLGVRSYLFKSFTVKDWMAFTEVFGMPIRLGKFGPGATEKDISKLLSAVMNIGTDAAGVIPESMQIELVDGFNGQGADVFERLANFCDEQSSKAILGQTMTTDNGSSKAQADVHDGVRKILVKADARYMEFTLNRDLVRPYVDLNWGPQERYPKARLAVPEPDDLKADAENLKTIVEMGVRVGESVVRDHFGWPDPAEGEETIGGRVAAAGAEPAAAADPALARDTRKPALNSDSQLQPVPDTREQLADHEASDWEPQLDPVVKPLMELAARVNSLDQFLAELPKLFPQMDASVLVAKLATAQFKMFGAGTISDSLKV